MPNRWWRDVTNRANMSIYMNEKYRSVCLRILISVTQQ